MRKVGFVAFCVTLICLISFETSALLLSTTDGSLMDTAFDSQEEIDDWGDLGPGTHRAENGELVFDYGYGDNAVDTTLFATGASVYGYALQVDFRVPSGTPMSTPYSIIGILKPNIAWVATFIVRQDAGSQYRVGVGDLAFTNFGPLLDKGTTYTVVLYATPYDEARYFLFNESQTVGSYMGSIGLAHNLSPSVNLRIGNVFGYGRGSLVVDDVRFGEVAPIEVEPWWSDEQPPLVPAFDIPSKPTPDEPIPEPSTIILLASGLAGLVGYSKLRRKRKN